MKFWVTLVIATGVFAQETQSEAIKESTALGSLEGHVIDAESRLPISGAKVSMIGLLHGRSGATASDRDGEFLFDQVPAGSYMFLANADGYREAPSPQREISAGAKVSIEITLIPESGIEGRVIDCDSRKPVAGITVKALREDRAFGSLRVVEAAHGITNKAGEYALSGLLPSKYFLVAEPPVADQLHRASAGELQPVPTWLPDALHKGDSIPVYVTAGHHYDGTDMCLRKASGYTISGIVSGLSEIADLEELTVRLAADGELLYDERAATPDRKGIFSFADVLPGRYSARLICKTKDKKSGAMATHLLAFEDVLVDKRDVRDLRLPVHWPIVISGQVSVDDSPDADLKGVRVMLMQTDGIVSGAYPQAEPNEDGSFALPTCDPARYAVGVRTTGGTYVRSITFNHREVLPSEIIDSSRGGGTLEVFLHKGGAELNGTVETQSGAEETSPKADARTVLIPVGWSPDWAIDLPAARIDKGSFSIHNIRPGTYYALALEAFDVLWKNPRLVREMQSRAETVTLNEGDRANVHLKLVNASDVERAALAVEQ